MLLPLIIIGMAVGGYVMNKKVTGTVIPATTSVHERKNAVYYWRTTFQLTDREREFLHRERVERMYLRMFDVVCNEDMAVPNATLTFGTNVPDDIEVVPTVFVTVEALRHAAAKGDLDLLAKKIVKRVTAMCSWNGIDEWNELQLDCDWTETTREAFFMLCKDVKERLKGKLLSSTIRLHQLSQEAPPVDYGVLMVYNTDRFDNVTTENSILNSGTVVSYLNKKLDFSLPLDIALPIFQWDIVFRNDKFVRIAKRYYEDTDSNEVVRHEQVPADELKRTQEILAQYLHLESESHSTVLYHLDTTNINSYSHEDIQSIYNR